MKTTHNIGYALLLVLFSITLHSCFLVRKHKTITKSTTDSTAYNKIESYYTKKAEEAWNNYRLNTDSSSTYITFYSPFDKLIEGDKGVFQYDKPENGDKIVVNPDGTIEVKGVIKEFVHKSGKQTTKKDSGSLKTDIATKYVRVKYDIVKTNYITKTLTVERKPDYWGYAKIAAILLLIGFVVWKWARIKLWVVDKAKGLFTNFFH